ncbi:MAG: rhodanese-like domain-containing protein [Gammaproteobacteria bacterium]|nr:rhodanese-like domain-containing protein [Gammaproteobacteria bacterium]MCW8909886.1 rhodanese-like domain-containing protein [Gammaproteobacteria bacterium]MCW9005704.1 rhodanese-like domain-containing protein [Gammaproteobacteria bacterium]
MISKSRKFSITALIRSLWLVALIAPITVLAENELTPEQIKGTTRIDAEQLINLAETTPALTIIDARISKDRIHGYIEGSISLPNTKTDCKSLSEIIKSSNNPTVYYCNGPKCGRSVKSIKIALSCGYRNIYWYRGGFEDWKENDYPFLIENK